MNSRVLGLAFCLLASPLLAVTSGMTLLPTGASDGKTTYTARFAIGLSVNGGLSWQTSAQLNQVVRIAASFDPDPAHVGGIADVFIVERYNNTFKMLTPSGTWLPWNGQIATLQPVRDDIVLSATQNVTIHDGVITEAGEHRMYVGYRPASSGTLIYSTSAAALNFTAAAPDPATYFTQTVFESVVINKCSLCHVSGGVASSTRLRFVRDSGKALENFDIFNTFYSQLANDRYIYVLGKASGTLNHTGGSQLPVGSSDYQNLATLLNLLEGGSGSVGGSQSLFTGVGLQDAAETLRDGALLLAGRLPTPAETAAATSGGDTALRATLVSMMTGTHFHNFIKDGANDRLHLRGNEDFNLMDDCAYCFPAINAEYWRLKDLADSNNNAANRGALNTYMTNLNIAAIEAPLELIAYVVENDKPYSEILTANYDMLTPSMNAGVGGTAVFPAGAGPLEFRPGRITGYYFRSPNTTFQFVPGAALPRITNPPTQRVDYPHAGVLNSKSFLSRYPTTATNRNRARARWTYYNFLGIDIEAQAKRTTDPVALADTNNPTMNNPACTVCHTVLDPVAGTFQDYADNGIYRSAVNGTDSLDRFYKSPQTGGGLYRTGDTWYRDMRNPGFEGTTATGDSMRWLAQVIVADPRFAKAAVRFWWPAVMGAELLVAPEATEDANYAARLAAYEQQQGEIDALATRFVASGLKLKTLLADLVTSPWYRAEVRGSNALSAVSMEARQLAPVTDEKLLTPEQLARKTQRLAGFNWNAQFNALIQAPLSGLENDYNTFYGGIDGFALKTRARLLTPMMSNVALTHALEASCPVVLGDFIRTDANRLLFNGLSPWTTPMTEASVTQLLSSTSATDFAPLTLNVALGTGTKRVLLSNLNDSCDWSSNQSQCRQNKNLVIDTVTIRRPNGQTTVLNSTNAVFGTCAATTGSNDVTIYSSCSASFAFDATTAGTYTITASVAGQQSSTDPVLAGLNVEATGTAAASTAAGATALRNKLVELHARLLGQTVSPTSPEVQASMDLLIQTWTERTSTPSSPSLLTGSLTCDWQTDIGFIATLGYPGNPLSAANRYVTEVTTWLAPQAQDPLYMKQSWVVVMAYLLSHYDYIHE